MRSKVLIGFMLLASSCLQTEVQPSAYDRLVKDMKVIDDYLAAHPGNPGDVIVKDASGVRLVISTPGTGTIPPNTGNTLKIAYTGRLLSDGSMFDSNSSYIVKLSDAIIDGWKLGIALLTKGATAKLYIPSGLGYGSNGSGVIPPNANLVFDITLIDVVPTSQQTSKLATDIASVDSYLAANQIVAQTHDSGIRYVMTQVGSGATPSIYDGVKVKLVAKLMTTGEVILDQTIEPNLNFSSRVVNYPHGVLIGLQLMEVGGKATFYVPNILANNMTGVPSNSNVIFEVELIDVVNE